MQNVNPGSVEKARISMSAPKHTTTLNGMQCPNRSSPLSNRGAALCFRILDILSADYFGFADGCSKWTFAAQQQHSLTIAHDFLGEAHSVR